MEDLYKDEYCKNCNNSIKSIKVSGSNNCPICGSKELITVSLNSGDILRCFMCGKTATVKELYKSHNKIPFFNSEDMTYYCGCKG